MERLRIWHRWWFLPLNVAGLFLLAAWWIYTANSPIARLRASGVPTTYEELVAEPIPDEQNVAAGLREVQPEVKSAAAAVADLRDDQGELPADRLTAAENLLEENREALAQLREALQRPRYVSLVRLEDFENPQRLYDAVGTRKDAARLLSFASDVAIRTEDPEAVELVLDNLRLAKLVENEPLMVGRLIACALQSMAIADAERLIDASLVSSQDIDRMDEALAKLEDRSSRVDSLLAERVHSIELISKMPFPGRFFLKTNDVLRAYEGQIARAQGGRSDSNEAESSALAKTLLPGFQSWNEAEKRVADEANAARQRLQER